MAKRTKIPAGKKGYITKLFKQGKTFRRLTRHERCAEIFAAWILIVQVATKQPERGLLADEDGALTAEDLSDCTGFPEDIFELAFEVLTDDRIGWLELA